MNVLDRIAAASGILTVRREEQERDERHGLTNGSVERRKERIASLRTLADELEAELR